MVNQGTFERPRFHGRFELSPSGRMSAGTSAVGRLGWYVRRLQSMELREVLWRLQQAAQRPTSTFESGFSQRDWEDSLDSFRAGLKRPVLLDRGRAALICDGSPDLAAQLLGAADLLVHNTFQFFGYPAVTLSRPVDWHRDPISKVCWPRVPSNKIDHRVAGGDAKWIWELNRLQHLPLLAEAWLFTGDDRYSSTAFEHLDGWIDQNPPGHGIAWRGAFEPGLRSISIAVALQGLRDAPELTVDRYQRIAQLLAVSAERCWQERSRYSSANNHLIGEMAGLATIGMLFPDLPGAAVWEQRAVQTLAAEAAKIILPDGCGAEQSIGYQLATVELLQFVAALRVERDGLAPKEITRAIARSSGFLARVVGENDPDPRYGDADQEFAVRLGPEKERTVRQHLGITATLGCGVGEANHYDQTLTAEWYRHLMPPSVVAEIAAEFERLDVHQDFLAPDGGLVVLRRGPRRITMDTGPLGYLSIAAHGHADALAVTLSVDGQDVIGDPGTGSYYQHPSWRSVMRGTRAHATVCVDDEDQSVIGGPFLWSRQARTRVRGIDIDAGVVDAEHDGYLRLSGKVMHRRWLIAKPHERTHLVVDLITGDGIHSVRTNWPLHPHFEVRTFEAEHIIMRDDKPVLRLLHAATNSITLDDSYGNDEPFAGWWSNQLESRTAAWWLSAVCRAELPVVIATLICPPDGVTTSGMKAVLNGAKIAVSWTEDGSPRTTTIRIDTSAEVETGRYPRPLESGGDQPECAD